MTDSSLVDHALAEADFIADHWDDLLEARQPGTRRPWRQSLLDPERRAQMAARDREERAVRDPDAPGFTSAPEYVDVLDVIVDAWTTLDELTALISPDWRRTRTGGAKPRAAAEYGPHRVTEIAPMLEFIRFWLPNTDVDEDKLGRLIRRLGKAAEEVTRLLSLVRTGQLLGSALCPWCKGYTPKHPEGGATTMRVEEIPGRPANDHRPEVPPATAVVCWNPLCDPPDEDCGVRYRGRPAWPWHDWDWLAKRLIVADPVITPVPKATFWDDPATFVIVHSGRSGVDQAIAVVPPHDALARRARAEEPGQPVRFVGGPFNGQLRRFTRLETLLGVGTSTSGRRRALVSVDEADTSTGIYRFEIVNDQLTYVWVIPSEQVSA